MARLGNFNRNFVVKRHQNLATLPLVISCCFAWSGLFLGLKWELEARLEIDQLQTAHFLPFEKKLEGVTRRKKGQRDRQTVVSVLLQDRK